MVTVCAHYLWSRSALTIYGHGLCSRTTATVCAHDVRICVHYLRSRSASTLKVSGHYLCSRSALTICARDLWSRSHSHLRLGKTLTRTYDLSAFTIYAHGLCSLSSIHERCGRGGLSTLLVSSSHSCCSCFYASAIPYIIIRMIVHGFTSHRQYNLGQCMISHRLRESSGYIIIQ